MNNKELKEGLAVIKTLVTNCISWAKTPKSILYFVSVLNYYDRTSKRCDIGGLFFTINTF